MKIYTIGYEGSNIEDFVAFLAKNKIQCIADVRKNPVSRKKGFSKNKLAERLREKNIDYVHLPDLGVPSDWRKRAKAKLITRAKMFMDYKLKILPKEKDALKNLREKIHDERTALLCYEADACDCHRHFVVEALLKMEKKKPEIVDLRLPEVKLSITGHALKE